MANENLEGQLAEKDQIIKDLRVDLAALTLELNESQGKFEEQISKIALEQDKMNAERDEKIKTLETKVEEMEALLDEKTAIKDLQKKLKVLESVHDKKVKEFDKVKGEKEKLQLELDKVTGKGKGSVNVKELQSLLKKKDAEVTELTMKIADLEGLHTELRTDQGEIVDAFDQQRARIKELEQIINSKQQKIDELSTGLDAQKLKAYDDFVSQLQTELNQVKSQLQSSEQMRTEQAGSIAKFETLLGQVTAQIEQQEAEQQAALQQQAAFRPPQPQSTQMQIPPPPRTAGPIAPAAPPSDVQFPKSTEIEVIQLLDKIGQIAQSGIAAQQLGLQMEQIRARIVEIYQWHPVLFEVAAFARRLKAQPVGVGMHPETLAKLLEQIEGWKARILS